MIVKGLKGKFEPIVEWYKEVLSNSDYLLTILNSNEEGWSSIKQMLDIFKAGFYSKQPEVAVWTCKLLTKMATNFHKKGHGGAAWDWFIGKPAGGLNGIFHCITKSHGVSLEALVALLCEFGKYNYVELFTHYFKLLFKQEIDYLRTVTDLIQPLADYKISKEEIINSGVLSFWIDISIKRGDTDLNPNSKPEDRAILLSLLLEIWTNFPNVVEAKDEYADNIIKMAQRANRDKNESLQLVSLALLFKLLDAFASERNPYSPIVYKTITFALVENHQKTKIREFILHNFKYVFEMYPNIPAAIVLEPFIKQIRRSEGITFYYNAFDFDFFVLIAKHPKLTVKNGVQTLDLLAKCYIYDDIYSGVAFVPFMLIAYRYKNDISFASFILKLLKVFLIFYNYIFIVLCWRFFWKYKETKKI